MAHSEKVDFPPLLPEGRWVKTLPELAALCVDAFPASSTRSVIMAGFSQVVEMLETAGIIGELWANGSFLTKKVDPGDIDVVLRMEGAFADSCTPDQADAINLIVSEESEKSRRCHAFVIVEWPDGHPRHWHGHYAYCYWMRQWGFDRSNTTKGMAVVKLPRGEP